MLFQFLLKSGELGLKHNTTIFHQQTKHLNDMHRQEVFCSIF